MNHSAGLYDVAVSVWNKMFVENVHQHRNHLGSKRTLIGVADHAITVSVSLLPPSFIHSFQEYLNGQETLSHNHGDPENDPQLYEIKSSHGVVRTYLIST